MTPKVLMATRSLRVELSPHREDPERSVLVVTRTIRNGAPRTLLIHTDELEEFCDAVCDAADIVCPEDVEPEANGDAWGARGWNEMTFGSARSGGGSALASAVRCGGASSRGGVK